MGLRHDPAVFRIRQTEGLHGVCRSTEKCGRLRRGTALGHKECAQYFCGELLVKRALGRQGRIPKDNIGTDTRT